jgi:hypothetical protein
MWADKFTMSNGELSESQVEGIEVGESDIVNKFWSHSATSGGGRLDSLLLSLMVDQNLQYS